MSKLDLEAKRKIYPSKCKDCGFMYESFLESTCPDCGGFLEHEIDKVEADNERLKDEVKHWKQKAFKTYDELSFSNLTCTNIEDRAKQAEAKLADCQEEKLGFQNMLREINKAALYTEAKLAGTRHQLAQRNQELNSASYEIHRLELRVKEAEAKLTQVEQERDRYRAIVDLVSRQKLEHIRPASNWGEVAFEVLKYLVGCARQSLKGGKS